MYLEVNISVWATHKNTWAQQTRSNGADKTFYRICYNIWKSNFWKYTIMNMQSIKILKNIYSLFYMMYLVFWAFTNSILFTLYSIILYHDYLDKRKK